MSRRSTSEIIVTVVCRCCCGRRESRRNGFEFHIINSVWNMYVSRVQCKCRYIQHSVVFVMGGVVCRISKLPNSFERFGTLETQARATDRITPPSNLVKTKIFRSLPFHHCSNNNNNQKSINQSYNLSRNLLNISIFIFIRSCYFNKYK